MQLIDFALIGFAVAAPTAQQLTKVDNPALTQPEVFTCPELNEASVRSNAKQGYRLQCAQWVDAPQEQLLQITTTDCGYKGCLDACDANADCGVSQFIATDLEQTKGSCQLYRKGVSVKQGASNSWTLATKTDDPTPVPASTPRVVPVPQEGEKFTLTSISRDPALPNTGIKAAHGHLTVGGGPSNATCDTPTDDSAIFYIQNGAAFLYAASATPQQLWVDRSGMGQGVTGYTTGAQPTPRNAERTGFSIDAQGSLLFNDTPAFACPPNEQDVGAGWSIWFTSQAPGFTSGCVAISLRPVEVEQPVSCAYTS